MPLNYSKWDALELSDDSDIEEHPNVDKRSMINWKRRDIHEKRERRRQLIANLRGEIALNNILKPRLESLRSRISADPSAGLSVFSGEVHRLKTNPSPDKPPTGHAKQPTYDEMLLDLLLRVRTAAVNSADGDKVDVSKLVEQLEFHEKELDNRSEECEKQAHAEEMEQKKKITSEDVHEGFDVGHVLKPKPSPMDDVKDTAAITSKAATRSSKTETQIEVLNPEAASKKHDDAPQIPDAISKSDEDGEVPKLTPAARAFCEIPLRAYDRSFEFIQRDPSVLVESTTDACLGEAFEAELKGDKARAKRCVHQGLMIQYCRKLGRDGVRLFFQRMQQAGPKAEAVFQNDVNDTYSRMEKRCAEIKKEAEASGDVDREQIQLVAEDPSTTIGFNIPDGPPPENLVLEGEGVQDLDVNEVKAFLQRKWDIFQSFSEEMKTALKTEKLDEVNKVLGKLSVAEAERVVELMQEGGMLSFSESGVRDMTGQ